MGLKSKINYQITNWTKEWNDMTLIGRLNILCTTVFPTFCSIQNQIKIWSISFFFWKKKLQFVPFGFVKLTENNAFNLFPHLIAKYFMYSPNLSKIILITIRLWHFLVLSIKFLFMCTIGWLNSFGISVQNLFLESNKNFMCQKLFKTIQRENLSVLSKWNMGLSLIWRWLTVKRSVGLHFIMIYLCIFIFERLSPVVLSFK